MKLLLLNLAILCLISSCKDETSEIKEAPITTETQIEYIQSEEQAALNLPFSEAVRIDDVLYLSGQIGTLPNSNTLVEGGIGPETIQTMENIKSLLERNGLSMDNVFKCTCMLADIDEWAQMSEEYIKFFPNRKPARSAFAGTGLALGARVEIECMAYFKID